MGEVVTEALLLYLCVWNTVMGVLLVREQRSAFRSRADQAVDRSHTLGALDDLVEAGLIRLELEGAGRKAVVARVRHQKEQPSEPGRHERVDGSLDLVHDLILRTSPDVGVRA